MLTKRHRLGMSKMTKAQKFQKLQTSSWKTKSLNIFLCYHIAENAYNILHEKLNKLFLEYLVFLCFHHSCDLSSRWSGIALTEISGLSMGKLARSAQKGYSQSKNKHFNNNQNRVTHENWEKSVDDSQSIR